MCHPYWTTPHELAARAFSAYAELKQVAEGKGRAGQMKDPNRENWTPEDMAEWEAKDQAGGHKGEEQQQQENFNEANTSENGTEKKVSDFTAADIGSMVTVGGEPMRVGNVRVNEVTGDVDSVTLEAVTPEGKKRFGNRELEAWDSVYAEREEPAAAEPGKLGDYADAIEEGLGKGDDLAAKVRAFAPYEDRLPDSDKADLRAAIEADANRRAENVISAGEWQKNHQTDMSPRAATLQRILDGHTLESLKALLNKWMPPDDVRLASSPEQHNEDSFKREKAAILATAPRGKDGHPLAHNGERSNLSEDQWATVRTGKFLKYFGDWVAVARQAHVRNAITRALDEKTWQERIVAAQGLDADPSGKLGDTFGFPVVKQFITPDDIRKTEKRHGAGNERQMDQLGLTREDFVKMMEVLRDPETFRKTRSSNGKPSAEFGREFSDGTLIVAEVEVSEQGAVSIKSAWKKQPGRNHEGATSYPVRTSENTAGLPTNLHSDSLIVNPESVSKVVDANGEPLVVWHGTNAEFDSFDPNLVGKVFGYDTKGFFFSSLESDAMDYAKHAAQLHGGTARTIPVFLDIKKPYDYAEHANEYGDADTAEKGMDGRLLIDWTDMYRRDHLKTAEEMGKDGISIERGKEGLYTAFDPSQIKSATDNNGEFSENPSILRSSAEPGRGRPKSMVEFKKPFREGPAGIAVDVFPTTEPTRL